VQLDVDGHGALAWCTVNSTAIKVHLLGAHEHMVPQAQANARYYVLTHAITLYLCYDISILELVLFSTQIEKGVASAGMYAENMQTGRLTNVHLCAHIQPVDQFEHK
jgi:hypothetical protein